MNSIYDLAEAYGAQGAPRLMPPEQAPAMAEPPVAQPEAALPVQPAGRVDQLGSLFERYFPQGDDYTADLRAAQTAYNQEAEAFKKMLEKSLAPAESPERDRLSQAEMYFRLAAAFGAPTKTGNFMESLGAAGGEAASILKERRGSAKEAEQRRLQLGLEAQKLRMASAKEDLTTLRGLASEGMKDKRTIAAELIKEYVRSGQPQSAAGKQAVDEGLRPGTPEYQARVAALSELNTERQMAQIQSTLAGLTQAQANFQLAQQRFGFQQQQAAKLSPGELTMKRETEDLVANAQQSLKDLKQAYSLNPNSLAGSWAERGQQFLFEAAGSKDPTIVNTRIINNLLGSQGLAKLKAVFGGAPTEGERNILMELEGIGSKTREERGAIIKRAYRVLQDRVAREQRRLDDINSGAYRTTEPIGD